MAPDPGPSSVIDRAIAAYDTLAELAETIEDEWSYVDDLTTMWRDVIAALADAPAASEPAVVVAIDRAIDEIARVEDPHRAIDWLSTFPQVVELAAGGAR